MDKPTSSQTAPTTSPLATSSHWASSMIDKAVHAETFLLEHIPGFNPETTFRAFPPGNNMLCFISLVWLALFPLDVMHLAEQWYFGSQSVPRPVEEIYTNPEFKNHPRLLLDFWVFLSRLLRFWELQVPRPAECNVLGLLLHFVLMILSNWLFLAFISSTLVQCSRDGKKRQDTIRKREEAYRVRGSGGRAHWLIRKAGWMILDSLNIILGMSWLLFKAFLALTMVLFLP
ncbi:hypothetical protein PG989_004530 [Apiospora arundinis]